MLKCENYLPDNFMFPPNNQTPACQIMLLSYLKQHPFLKYLPKMDRVYSCVHCVLFDTECADVKLEGLPDRDWSNVIQTASHLSKIPDKKQTTHYLCVQRSADFLNIFEGGKCAFATNFHMSNLL